MTEAGPGYNRPETPDEKLRRRQREAAKAYDDARKQNVHVALNELFDALEKLPATGSQIINCEPILRRTGVSAPAFLAAVKEHITLFTLEETEDPSLSFTVTRVRGGIM